MPLLSPRLFRKEKRSSLRVPFKSMKNLSCPDLTKAVDQSDDFLGCNLDRAPSMGGSIGNCSDSISLHSDLGTDDQDDSSPFIGYLKNRDILKRNRYLDDLEDSDSSDCSHIEMIPVSDDDARQTQSDKSSSGSPKLPTKASPYLKQRKKYPVPPSPLAQSPNNKIPSIRVTCDTQAQESNELNQTDWLACQLVNLKKWVGELQEDFSECSSVEVTDLPPKNDEEPFSLKYTKETLFRFACVDSSLRLLQHECIKLIQWKSPLLTMLFIGAFLHGLWREYLLSLLFLVVTLGLVRNYINMKGFLGVAKDIFTTDHKKLGIGMGIDKVPAIMSLNMKIAKTFHVLSDVFDKSMSLWTWRKPMVTMKILGILGCLLVYSMLRPNSEIIKVSGTLIVMKVFFFDYVFLRFPKVRAKYDFAWILWNQLPTGPDIEKEVRLNKKKEKLSKKKSDPGQAPTITIKNREAVESRPSSPLSCREDDTDILSSIFQIPSTEICLPGWEHGKKCTLIKKERSLTSAFRNGRLYLTDNHLLFLRHKTQHPKNLTIPLCRILKLTKGKPYSWIPGDGMSIVVTTSTGNVHIFGSVSNREDTFRCIVEQGLQRGYNWASTAEFSETKQQDS